MSINDKYSAEAFAQRIHDRAQHIGMQAAIDEIREALSRAEWMCGKAHRVAADDMPAEEQRRAYSRSARVTP